ncbi:MAG TPA: ester cyclase [Umezawaea sp.]|nr:ester cyclase [Umezawaea sp.]
MEPKTVVRQYWAGFEKGDLDTTWETYVAPEPVIHPASRYEFTRESWPAAEKELLASFTDLRVEVLDQVAEGDKVASRRRITATQTSEFSGVASRGRTATLTGTTVDRVVDDLIVEHWAEVGVPGFLRQLSD